MDEYVAFVCCDRVTGITGYRRHMDECHNGRSETVLHLTRPKLLRVLRGENPWTVGTER